MDYRGYENKFNEIKKSIVDFITSRNQKVYDYALGTVSSYLELLDKNDISIKSFKLKIVHNEQTSQKNINELEEIIPNLLNDAKQFLNVFFQDYDKNLPNYKFYQNRKTDLIIINNHLKRKRQDALVRINNYEKDLSNKEKEKNLLILEKNKSHNQFVVEINRRLNIDLQRTNDNSIKEYSPLERELLDIDEKEQIISIKEKIKTIRNKCLEKQTELKIKSFSNLKEEEIKLVQELNNINLEFENQKFDYECKILENKKNIQLYQLEEIKNSFDFDYQKDVESIEKFKKSVEEYLDIIKAINFGVLNDSKYQVSKEELIRMKINKTALEFYQAGFFNPVINVMKGFESIFGEINKYYFDLLKKYKNEREEKYLKIFEKLEKFDESIFKAKKTNFDNFLSSIDIGLNNLYSNEYLDKQKSILLNFLDEIINIVIEISRKFIDKLDEKRIDFDNILVDGSEMNNNYDEYDEKLCQINDKIRLIKNNSDIYYDTYLKNRNKEKNDFYSDDKEKQSSIESNFLINVSKKEKDVKKINDNNNLLLQKKIKDLNNEFNKNCLEVNNILKYNKKIL